MQFENAANATVRHNAANATVGQHAANATVRHNTANATKVNYVALQRFVQRLSHCHLQRLVALRIVVCFVALSWAR